MKWFMLLTQFNTVSVIVRVFLAMFLGGLIGIEREKSKRPAGFRTHILVCVGSCLTALIGLYVWNEFGHTADPMRISAQVISGIGFLGVGTILVKEHDHITGLTTAAGLWATASIGIACGFGFYEGALIGTLVVAITAAILFKFEARGRKKNRKYTIYMEVQGTDLLNEYIDWLVQEWKAKNVLVVAPRTAISGNVGLEVVLPFIGNEDGKEVLEKLRKKDGILFVYDMFMTTGSK
ncbi:MAG: MgtC/SapB family protein [Lachnospiraceae bacterium]|nr:MgtC/SapB family protein [Lachnospiraceae bacterium]